MSTPEKKEKFLDKLKKPFRSHSKETDSSNERRKSSGSFKRLSISSKHSDKDATDSSKRKSTSEELTNHGSDVTNDPVIGTTNTGSMADSSHHDKIYEAAYIEGQKLAESKFGKKLKSGYLPWKHHHEHDHNHDSKVIQSTSVGNVVTTPPKPVTVPIEKDAGDFSNFKHPTHNTVVRDDEDNHVKAVKSNENPLYSNEAQLTKGTGYFYDPKDTQGGEYKNLNNDPYNEQTRIKYRDFAHLKTEPTKYQQEEDAKRQEQKHKDEIYVSNEKGFNEDIKYQSEFSTDKTTLDPKETHLENKSAFNKGGISLILGDKSNAMSDNASTAALYSNSGANTPNIQDEASGKPSAKTGYFSQTNVNTNTNSNTNTNDNDVNDNEDITKNTGIIAAAVGSVTAAVGGVSAAVGLSGKDKDSETTRNEETHLDGIESSSTKKSNTVDADGRVTYNDYSSKQYNDGVEKVDSTIGETIGTPGVVNTASDVSKEENVVNSSSDKKDLNQNRSVSSEKYTPTHYSDKNFDYDVEIAKLDKHIESTQAEIEALKSHSHDPVNPNFVASSSFSTVGARNESGSKVENLEELVNEAYKEGYNKGKGSIEQRLDGATLNSKSDNHDKEHHNENTKTAKNNQTDSSSSNQWPEDIPTADKELINAAYVKGGEQAAYDYGFKSGAYDKGVKKAAYDHGIQDGAYEAGTITALKETSAKGNVSKNVSTDHVIGTSAKNEKLDLEPELPKGSQSSDSKENTDGFDPDVIVSVQGAPDGDEAAKIAESAIEQLKKEKPEILEIAKELKIDYQSGNIFDEYGQKVERVKGFGGPLEARYVDLPHEDKSGGPHTGFSSSFHVGPTSTTKSGFLEEFDENISSQSGIKEAETKNTPSDTTTENIIPSPRSSKSSNKEAKSSNFHGNIDNDDFADCRRLSDPKLAGIFAGGLNQGYLSKHSNLNATSHHESSFEPDGLNSDSVEGKVLNLIQENTNIQGNKSNITSQEAETTPTSSETSIKVPGSFIP